MSKRKNKLIETIAENTVCTGPLKMPEPGTTARDAFTEWSREAASIKPTKVRKYRGKRSRGAR